MGKPVCGLRYCKEREEQTELQKVDGICRNLLTQSVERADRSRLQRPRAHQSEQGQACVDRSNIDSPGG